MNPRGALTVAVALALAACQYPGPTQPSSVTQTQTVNIGQGGTPTASPSPGGTLPPGAFLRNGFFGISCPQGTTAPPNGLRELPQNCRGFMTVTPKYQDGSDIPASIHGPNCSWEVTSGASIVNLATTGENFNRDATCNGVGPWIVKNVVMNLQADTTFNCTAVAGARSSSSPHRVYTWDEEALASAARRMGIHPEQLREETIDRDRRQYGARAEVSSMNCNNCHPPLDPDPGPGGGGGGWLR